MILGFDVALLADNCCFFLRRLHLNLYLNHFADLLCCKYTNYRTHVYKLCASKKVAQIIEIAKLVTYETTNLGSRWLHSISANDQGTSGSSPRSPGAQQGRQPG